MQSETMEDDDISRLALPRQDVVKPLLDVLDRHVFIFTPSYLCLDLNIFLMMLFRSIFWETNPPGSFWLLRTSEDGTTVPILNETPVMLNFFLKHQFVPIFYWKAASNCYLGDTHLKTTITTENLCDPRTNLTADCRDTGSTGIQRLTWTRSLLVSYPTRWSLLFIFGFLYGSSYISEKYSAAMY